MTKLLVYVGIVDLSVMKLINPHFISVKDLVDETSILRHFFLILPAQQKEDNDILATFTASSLIECLLRCSHVFKCESASIQGMKSIGRRSNCLLYRTQLKKSLKNAQGNHFKNTQFYNKKKVA